MLEGWNQISALIPGGVFILLAAVGAGIAIWALSKWWAKKEGGGMRGFPWIQTLFGAFLASLKVAVPGILIIFEVLLKLLLAVVGWAAGLFG